jgi:type II restriction enzyme
MIELIKSKGIRDEFEYSYSDRMIIPDGGVLFLEKKDGSFKKPILISEVKRQGTNKERIREGKEKQATGNAIERLGKNLIGVRSMMNHERVTPFVCFGWGDDFAETEKTVLSKVFVMNEFYPLNKIFVNKKDGDANFNRFSPVSMYFREPIWTVEEMFDIMKEIAETALRYYIY